MGGLAGNCFILSLILTFGIAIRLSIALILLALLAAAVFWKALDKPVDRASGQDAQPASVVSPVVSPGQKGDPDGHTVPVSDALRDACPDTLERIDAASNQATSNEEIKDQINLFQRTNREIANALSVSSSPDHLYVAALLAEDTTDKIRLMARVLEVAPHDPFFLRGAVELCATTEEDLCAAYDWEHRMIAADSEDSGTWVRVAANRYGRGDINRALEALERANSTTQTRSFWVENMEIVERSLAAVSDMPFAKRASHALSIAVNRIPDVGAYHAMCTAQSKTDVEWAEACLAFGRMTEERGTNLLSVAIAQDIQNRALKTLGREEEAAIVGARRERAREELETRFSKYGLYSPEITVAVPELFFEYVNLLKTVGERQALEDIETIILRRIGDSPEATCAALEIALDDVAEP